MNLLVHNPNSSNADSARYWKWALQRIGFEVVSHDGSELREMPILGKENCLIVVGGDGTARRYADWCSTRGCTLGILPAGTGNDFARGIDLPLNPDGACVVIGDGTGGARHAPKQSPCCARPM